MARTIPGTLRDAIDEEPDRFLNLLDLDAIFSAKNPYNEFLRQFEKKFGQKQGLNLWQYLVGKYQQLNKLYKNEIIQEGVQEEFQGPLDREQTSTFFDKRNKRIMKKQETLIRKRIKKPKKHTYSDRQKRFILSRKSLPLRELTYEFNRAFKIDVTKFGVRDKKLRLLGRKR